MEIIGDFFRAGVPIVAGTDNVVPVYSLYLEIESYHRLAKLTPLQAIRTATIIPVQVMGLDTDTGTLEVGKEADIAILDENPLLDISHIRTVSAVMTNGTYYESEPLWAAADFVSGNN
jgi:imidazolonepropionase-like amidohydrolase